MNRLLRSSTVTRPLCGPTARNLAAFLRVIRYNSTNSEIKSIVPLSDTINIERPILGIDSSDFIGSDEILEKSEPFRGKKLAPPDQEIVILSPERTGMYRRVPNYFNTQKDDKMKLNNPSLDFVTGKDIANVNGLNNGPTKSRKTKSPKFVSQDLANRQKNLMVYSTPESHDAVIDSITYMKPFSHGGFSSSNVVVSINRYDQLAADINQAFTASQLREYGIKYADIALRKKFGFSRFKKAAIVDFILNKMWGITKSNSIAAESDLMVDRFLPLTMRDLFLVLTDYGALIDKWTTNGAIISVQTGGSQPGETSPKNNTANNNTIGIHVRAPFKTLTYVEASLSQIMTHAAVRELDLATLRQLVDLDAIPFTAIEKQSHVYLDRSIPQTLVAHAINAEKLDHVLRYLITCLCFGRRKHPEAFVYDLDPTHQQSAAFFRIPVDDQLPWYLRAKEWARWRYIRQSSNTALKDILESSSDNCGNNGPQPTVQYNVEADKHIRDNISQVKSEISVRELIDAEFTAKPAKPSQTSDAGIGRLIDVFSSSKTTHINDNNEQQNNIKKMTTEQRVEWLYKSLKGTIMAINQGRYAQLSQDPAQTITYTATFGSLLHHTSSAGSRGQLQKKLNEDLNIANQTATGVQAKATRTFTTTLPYLNQTVNNLSLYNETDIDGTSNNIIGQDYHDYMVQLSFVPDPFHGALEECEAAPPVEMWIPLDEFEQGDITAAQIVTLDQESSTILSMPDKPCDLKLAMTHTTAVDFSQVGVHRFLNDCQLDFSAEKKIRIPNFLEMEINESQIHTANNSAKTLETAESTNIRNKKRKVRYVYEAMKYRRQIDFQFEGHLLQYVVTEGGALGGRATEANLVLDPTLLAAISESDLKKFTIAALKFVNTLAEYASR